MLNNSINRYGNPNATRGYFGGKSHSHPRLVKQRQLKLNKDENGRRKLFLYQCFLVMSTNLEYRSIYLQRVDYKHICLFFCFFFVVFFVPESLLNPFGNVQFIQKWHYYSLKSLLLSKQHHQTTKPRSLLHKSMLEDNWIFGQSHVFSPLERCKFLGYKKITFLSPKKISFQETTSSNDKTNVTSTK